jgi:hypothetical protein
MASFLSVIATPAVRHASERDPERKEIQSQGSTYGKQNRP